MTQKVISNQNQNKPRKEATYWYGENSKLACQTRHKCIHNEQPK